MCFVKRMKREYIPLVCFVMKRYFKVKGLNGRYFFKKNNLLTLMDNLFSGSKENTYLFFLIHFLNRAERLFLLPRNFRNQKNILYVVCGARSLL